MSNATLTIAELDKARDLFVRRALTTMLENQGADELVDTLAEVIEDFAMALAKRQGDYGRAAALNVIAEHLRGLDKFIANYDPTP